MNKSVYLMWSYYFEKLDIMSKIKCLLFQEEIVLAVILGPKTGKPLEDIIRAVLKFNMRII